MVKQALNNNFTTISLPENKITTILNPANNCIKDKNILFPCTITKIGLFNYPILQANSARM